jgi:hypothetical protein
MRERLPIVLSVTALAVAVLGATPVGEAAADLVIARGSVGTAQLKNGAVTSVKVKNRSLLAVDFRRGQLPAGPAGPPGPVGPVGPGGPPGVSGYQLVFTTGVGNTTSFKTLNATCPAGKRALGGGVAITPSTAATAVAITRSYVGGNATVWETAARETTAFAGSWGLNAVVICANVAG